MEIYSHNMVPYIRTSIVRGGQVFLLWKGAGGAISK